jgi:hypothetical protein
LLANLTVAKMNKMAGYQLAVAYGILLDKERDIRGLTAQNHSTFVNLIVLADSKDMGRVQEAIEAKKILSDVSGQDGEVKLLK